MANGSELHLGFVHGARGFAAIAAALAIEIDGDPRAGDPAAALEIKPSADLDKIQRALSGAHDRALREIGFEITGRNLRLNHTLAETPLGPREFSAFYLGLHFDPNEMGEGPEQAILSVGVTGRYWPTFADWRDTSGGLWPFAFDKDLRRAQRIARKHIIQAIPAFAKAIWIVKEMHY